MDPIRIVVRVAVAYLVLNVLVRLTGKRTIQQGSPFDFTLALIIGDMVDDLLWAEVAASQFLVACGTLVFVQSALKWIRYRSGSLGR